ncbi:hypothetical protein [Ruegeria atlantica]|uniref:hypothetical protein n=1 Tax=Ruegeria atlantica TaxID=81569 RepID=UPI0024954598|nr:hypothetical protein [Ruegeria atlantica]
MDADAYANRPFETKQGYLFPKANLKRRRMMNGVLAFPSENLALKQMCEFAFESDLVPPWWPEDQQKAYLCIFGKSTYWGLPLFRLGPPMLYYYVSKGDETSMATPRTDLYSIPPRFRALWYDPDISKLDFLEWQDKMSIHFYGSWFRRMFLGVKSFNEGSLIDQLLKNHQIDPAEHPIWSALALFIIFNCDKSVPD